MKSRPSRSDVCKCNRLKVLEKVRFSCAIEKDGKSNFGIGHSHIRSITDIVLESPKRRDASLISEWDFWIYRGVGTVAIEKLLSVPPSM